MGLTTGIPLKNDKKMPTHAVERIVSTAPMWFSVFVPYTAPKVRVGATTVMKIRAETATVF
jgi:hypothetical protein